MDNVTNRFKEVYGDTQKLHISGSDLYKEKRKVKYSTLTKAGFAIYSI